MDVRRLSASHCVWAAGAVLGEGPVWHPVEQVLYFVDVKGAALLRHDPVSGEQHRVGVAGPLGCVAPSIGTSLIAGFKDGVFVLDPRSGERRKLVDLEPSLPGNRLNDGRCDVAGRFWVGSMDDGETEATGSLWRVDPAGAVSRMDEGYCITNGPAFSPDGLVLYHTDTLARTIYAFDLSAVGGLSGKRVFARFGASDGYPDGLCVDAEGGVWSGHWGGSRLTRFSPKGVRLAAVELPTENVTCCTFGGPELRTLFITTARKGLSAAQLSQQPLAGGLFAVELDLAGLPAPAFASHLSEVAA